MLTILLNGIQARRNATKFLSCMILVLVLLGCGKEGEEWQKAMSEDTIVSYEVFLRLYPKGEFSDEARNRVSLLTAEKAWKDAKIQDSIEVYEKFLAEYPEGLHVKEAKIRRDELVIERDWEKARTEDTERSYHTFVQSHPESAFAEKARLLLEEKKAIRGEIYVITGCVNGTV